MKQLSFIFPFHGSKNQMCPALFTNHKLKSREGFTIMEVALAATVLALTLVGMIQVVESGSEMLDLSRKQTIAAQILQDEIDQLRLQTWAQVTSMPAPATDISADSTFSIFKQQMGGNFQFTGVRTITYLQPAPPPPSANTVLLAQVTYTVSWIGVTGHKYTRTSTTYVGKNGLNVAYQRS